jgi:hypothetical protein
MSEHPATGDRHHYVSQFHLRAFVDPLVPPGQEPWLWVGDVKAGTIKRRAPKNVAWERGLFSGPGGLAQRDVRLEEWLATSVEAPAAAALRTFVSLPVGQTIQQIPPPLGRYLAWAAARGLPMRGLYEKWISEAEPIGMNELAELPPASTEHDTRINRGSWLEHVIHGALHDVPHELVGKLQEQGWRVRLAPADFLELTHLQAWEFQSRWFPKLHWSLLWAPEGSCFVLGDRPVLWQADGLVNAPPAALGHPSAQLLAPLTPHVALLGSASERRDAPGITPGYVNRLSAASALSWIFGSSSSAIEESLVLLSEARRG